MSESQIIQNLQSTFSFILKSKGGDQSTIRIPRSVSFQACAHDINEVKPLDFLYQCAAIASLKREAVDPIVIKYICWLPCLLMEYSFSFCFT